MVVGARDKTQMKKFKHSVPEGVNFFIEVLSRATTTIQLIRCFEIRTHTQLFLMTSDAFLNAMDAL